MAQILKFDVGGKTKKYGTLTIDGISYKGTDDLIKQMHEHKKTEKDYRVQQHFDKIINEIASGRDVTYSAGNMQSNIDWGLNDKKTEKLSTTFRKGSGDEKYIRQSVNLLGTFLYTEPSEPEPETPKKKKYDISTKLPVEWQVDDNGDYVLNDNKRVWVNSYNNQQVLDRFKTIETIINSPEEFDFVGYDDMNLDVLKSYIKDNKSAFDKAKNDLQTGNVTPETIEILNDFGIIVNHIKTSEQLENAEEADAKSEAEEKEQLYQTRGVPLKFQNIINVDEDGWYTIQDPSLASIVGTDNVWINEDFVNKYPTYRRLLQNSPEGLFLIDGKVYRATDPALYKNNTFIKFVDNNKKNPRSNKYVKQYWSDAQPDDWRLLTEFGGKEYYSPHGNMWIRDITGNYLTTPPINEDGMLDLSSDAAVVQLLPNEVTNDMYDQYGHLKPEHYSYAWLYDGKIAPIADWNTYQSSLSPSTEKQKAEYYSKTPFYLNEIYQGPKSKIINLGNNLYENLNNGQLYTIWTDKKTGTKYMGLVKNINGNVRTLHKYNNGNYGIVNLSKYGLTDEKGRVITHKSGGKILKAQHGAKWWEIEALKQLAQKAAKTVFNKSSGSSNSSGSTLSSGSSSNPYSFKNTNNQLLAQAKKNAQLSNSANSYYKSRRAIPTIELTGVSNAQRSNKGLKPLAGIGNFKQKGNELIHPITYNTVKSNAADQKINEDLTSKPTLNTEKAQQDVNQSIADTLLEMQTRDTKGSNVNNENNAFWSTLKNIDWTNLGRLALTAWGNDKATKNSLEALNKAKIASQQVAPKFNRPIYTDNGIGRQFDNEIEKLNNAKFITSDPVSAQNFAMSTEEQKRNLRVQKYLEQNKALTDFTSKLLQVDQMEKQAAIDTANKNRLQAAQYEQLKAQVKNQGLLSNIKSFENKLFEMAHKQADQKDKTEAARRALSTLLLEDERQNALKQAFDQLGGWNKMSDEIKDEYQSSNNYLAALYKSNPEEYMRIINKYKVNAFLNSLDETTLSQLGYEDELSKLGITFHKKGGSIKPFYLGEKMFLQQQKDFNKSMQNLNKDLMKLFIQIMKQ